MKSGVDYWKDGLEIVKKDAVSWMIASFVAYLLCMIPGVGIVSLFHMAEKGKKGEKISVGDALFGLQKLVPSLIAGIVFMIPFCLCTLPGIYFGPQMMWAFAMLARGEETDGMAAIKKSMALVRDRQCSLLRGCVLHHALRLYRLRQYVRRSEGRGIRTGRNRLPARDKKEGRDFSVPSFFFFFANADLALGFPSIGRGSSFSAFGSPGSSAHFACASAGGIPSSSCTSYCCFFF
jgi:hypothetical protein